MASKELFGGIWKVSLCIHSSYQDINFGFMGSVEKAKKAAGRIRGWRLLHGFWQFGELRIEIGESAGKLFAVARVLAGLQLFFDASAR